MKKLLFYTLVLIMGSQSLFSCKTPGANGQVIGVQTRPQWKNEQPMGMNYIKAGQLYIGQADEDINMSMYQRPKSVTVAGFYMDDTEVTNNEYRQFVYWVRDSIAHVSLDHVFETADGESYIDWENYPLDYSKESPDAEELDFLYYSEEDRLNGKKEVDVRQLKYTWDWIDRSKLAGMTAEEAYNKRSELISRDTVQVYPDTLVWMRDFQYSHNEPMAEGYFSHPAYDNYPVVGVTWDQARAFSNWSSKFWETSRADHSAKKKKSKIEILNDAPHFRLPTEYEFEYAARGGRISSTYPWGLNYLRNNKGCLLANFKPGRGNYALDGGFYTVEVAHYNPNDFGLYDMAGNVSEWTETAFMENAHAFIHDLNPSVSYTAKDDDPITLKRKVIRGGSWKDIGYFLQTGVRDWEYQDSAKSYIGFRRVVSFRGRTLTD